MVEQRVSRLEGAFEQFPDHMASLDSRISSLENGLRAEINASENTLRAEIGASESRTQAEINSVRADIKSAELRITVWLVGTVLAASALIVAAIKLLP